MAASPADIDNVARQVRAASTSFYGAMRVLERNRREAIFAIYAFCRAVDDVADDEGLSTAQRNKLLDEWRQKIDTLFANQPDGSISRALVRPIAEFDLQKKDFTDIIDGMQMDADGPIVAPTSQQLDLYCDRVASAVGRLCVHIFGEPGEAGMDVAHHLGRALQLTNILRDVDEDAEIGRLYLPADVLARHRIPTVEPKSVTGSAGYPSAWRELAVQAEDAFRQAEAALARCDGRKMRPARIMLEVYRKNLIRMMKLSDADLANPAVSKRLVGKLEKMLIALRHAIF